MNLPEAEDRLVRTYQEELAHYAEARAAAGELRVALARGDDPGDLLARIAGRMDEVARLEADLAGTKELWQRAGARPGPELRAVLSRLAAAVEELAGVVRGLEDDARAKKTLLAPELDELARARQMQRAYGSARGR